jgi:hypothetical protein
MQTVMSTHQYDLGHAKSVTLEQGPRHILNRLLSHFYGANLVGLVGGIVALLCFLFLHDPWNMLVPLYTLLHHLSTGHALSASLCHSLGLPGWDSSKQAAAQYSRFASWASALRLAAWFCIASFSFARTSPGWPSRSRRCTCPNIPGYGNMRTLRDDGTFYGQRSEPHIEPEGDH